MTIFLDLTRIATRLLRGGPTGIDRVELAYAKALAGGERGGVVNVLTTPLGQGCVPPQAMSAHLRKIEQAWLRDEAAAAEDPHFAAVSSALAAPIDTTRRETLRLTRSCRRIALRKALQFPFTDIVKAPMRFRRALAQAADGQPAVYFHASHTQLDKPRRFDWLRRHSIPSVFLIHDTIPVDFPEFCSPGSAERHRRRLLTVSERASAVVANSETTGRSVRRFMTGQGWRVPEIEVVPLGADERFRANGALPAPNGDYFICVGTIEPRKNLLFLFNLWRELASRLGARTPRLVIAGRRGWENEAILDVLERSHALAPFVVEVADLYDAGLAALIEGAAGLLAPSHVEGFSLPVLEALAIGTPVIASNIEAHRELARGRAHLLSPIDGPGWLEAVLQLRQRMGPAAPRAAPPVTALSWDVHVETTLEILRRVSKQRPSLRGRRNLLEDRPTICRGSSDSPRNERDGQEEPGREGG